MFAMVLVNTACDDNKEELTPKFNHIIELDELMGYWQHQSTEYMGDVITNCDELSASSKIPENKKGLIIFDLNIKPTLAPPTDIIYFDAYCDWFKCNDNNIYDWRLKLHDTENKITIGSNTVFEVLSYDKTRKTLKIKMVEPDESYNTVGAIYTLKKQ
jgi:hypothetical protein